MNNNKTVYIFDCDEQYANQILQMFIKINKFKKTKSTDNGISVYKTSTYSGKLGLAYTYKNNKLILAGYIGTFKKSVSLDDYSQLSGIKVLYNEALSPLIDILENPTNDIVASIEQQTIIKQRFEEHCLFKYKISDFLFSLLSIVVGCILHALGQIAGFGLILVLYINNLYMLKSKNKSLVFASLIISTILFLIYLMVIVPMFDIVYFPE